MWDESGFAMVKGTLGLIKTLANSGGYGIRIIMCDTEVTADLSFEDVMKAVSKKSLSALGGGGSNFIPAFEYIWNDAKNNSQSQAPILCITDGYIDVPDKQPKIKTDTAWITPKSVNPPTKNWGKHMEMIF
jgi:predicted metal-dependent peptidase